jgi:hypothetical protein
MSDPMDVADTVELQMVGLPQIRPSIGHLIFME